MCGIWGVASGPNADKKKVARILDNLAMETRIRGTDATGLAYIDEHGHTQLLKYPESATEAIRKDEWEAVMDNPPDILIGHNRAKTVGAPTNPYNNHPIISKTTGIAVIHNGGISNHDVWRNKLEDGFNFMMDDFDGQVDSEAILRMIEATLHLPRDEAGKIDQGLARMTPKQDWVRSADMITAIRDAVFNLKGGQACALVDPQDPNTLYLWKTSNPMVLAYVPEMDSIFFASTKEILAQAMSERYAQFHFGLFRESYDEPISDYVLYEVPGNTLMSIVLHREETEENRFTIDSHKLVPFGAEKLLKAFTNEDVSITPLGSPATKGKSILLEA